MAHASIAQSIFSADDWALLDRTHENHLKIHAEMAKVVTCPKLVIDEILIALFCDGHVLLSGPAGLARGLVLFTLSRILDLTISRIQYTSDLLPDDITGCEVEDLSTNSRKRRFIEGPIFHNMIKADDLSLAPRRTQAVLLQAMQDGMVRVNSRKVQLEKPFLVVASQYRVEKDGIHSVPDDQLHRFLVNPCWDYPSAEEELVELIRFSQVTKAKVERIIVRAEVLRIQGLVRRLPIAEPVVDHVVLLSRAASGRGEGAGQDVNRDVVQCLVRAAKAHAVLHGQPRPTCDDVNAIAPSVLRHRFGRGGKRDLDLLS